MLGKEDFDLIADEIKRMVLGTGFPIPNIDFYMMGEPYLNKELFYMIRQTRQLNLTNQITVTSNGSLIKGELIDKTLADPPDYLRISIYGANEKDQKANSASNISLASIRENILRLHEKREELGQAEPYIYIKTIDSLDSIKNDIFLNYFGSVGDEQGIDPRMDWDSPLAPGTLANIPTEEYISSRVTTSKEVCPYPFYRLVIHSDLKVSVCCVDWSKSLVVGDLRREGLGDIWKGEKLRDIQLAHLERQRCRLEPCNHCTYHETAEDNLDNLNAKAFLARQAIKEE